MGEPIAIVNKTFKAEANAQLMQELSCSDNAKQGNYGNHSVVKKQNKNELMCPVNSSLAGSVLRDPKFKIEMSNNSKDVSKNLFQNNLQNHPSLKDGQIMSQSNA